MKKREGGKEGVRQEGEERGRERVQARREKDKGKSGTSKRCPIYQRGVMLSMECSV